MFCFCICVSFGVLDRSRILMCARILIHVWDVIRGHISVSVCVCFFYKNILDEVYLCMLVL